MYLSKPALGFSLIELVVVMAIMAILMSLSGGLFQKSISQQERQVELEKVSQLFHQLSYQAYYGGKKITVRLEKNKLIIMEPVSETETANQLLNFEQLTFVAQDYKISSKGIITPDSFALFWNETIRRLPLESTFNEIKGQ